ncbi:MAG: hypothetical protein V9G19_20205 [Tetrasphaera sp.]
MAAGQSHGPPLDPVAGALAQVVSDFGPSVIYSPGRLRASLSDVLGAIGRQCRAEVDAVTVAAEEGVAAAISAEGAAPDDWAKAITGRGISPEMAAYAVAAWQGALLGSHAGGDSVVYRADDLQRTVRRPTRPGAGSAKVNHPDSAVAPPQSPIPEEVGDARATETPPTVVAPAASAVKTSTRSSPKSSVPSTSPPERRSLGLVALAAVMAPILVALAWLAFRYVDNGNGRPSPSQTEQGQVSTLPTDSASLSARQTVWDDAVPFAWSDLGCTRDKPPTSGVDATPCAFVLKVGVDGSVTDWRVTRVQLHGPGSVEIAGPDTIVYRNSHNGPYAATVTYWVEGGGYQSPSRWILEMKCNTAFPCGAQ